MPLARVRQVDAGPLFQLPPTTSFWLKYGSVSPLMRIPSLGSDAPSGWEPNMEAWYRSPSVGLQVLASHDDLTLVLEIACSGDAPCSEMTQELETIENDGWVFELNAKGVLKQDDWSDVVPELVGDAHYYYEGTSPEQKIVRVVFDVAGDDLVQIVWLSDTQDVDCYFKAKKQGDTMTLKYQGGGYPTGTWYYYAAKATQ